MRKEPEYRCIFPIQIRFNDIDGQQHVNNAIYQSYYDIGRSGYFSEIFRMEYQTGGRSVVVASVKTDFKAPIFLHDRIQVETRVSRIGNKSLTMEQQITCTDTGSIKSTCTTIFAGFDYERQETIMITDEMRKAINDYEKSAVE